MGALCPKEFQNCFVKWMNELHDRTQGQIVAIDGKTLRGSYSKEGKKGALHMVSAFCVRNQLVLGQVRTSEKSNEITAIPELLDILDIRNCLVTIDAMGCQTDIASKIINKEGDYLLQVKANQQKLLEAFEKELSFVKIEEILKENNQDYFEKKAVEHGREEKRQYFIFEPMGELKRIYGHWKNVSKVGVALRFFKNKGDDGSSFGIRYYITSKALTPEEFGEAVRGHWCIENNMHWQLDVSMNEDSSRVHVSNAAENLSTIRRAALNLLKQEKSVEGE
jgi:predicted transposase YbfD/YdcC